MKKGKESSPRVMGETDGPEIIEIVDNADSLDEQDDEIEMSLKGLFPGKHKVSLSEVNI